MNILTEWLGKYFDEISPKEFYRTIFPEGSFQKKGEQVLGEYNGIIVSVTRQKRSDGSPVIKRYIVTDDLEAIDQVCQTDDFCIMSPLSYAGKTRIADHARVLYGFAVDLDHIRMKDEDPIGLRTLWNNHIEGVDRIPKPTFIVSSGTGLHLYYVLTEPIALYKDIARRLQGLKRDLTSLIWHDTIVDIKSVNDIQQEGIYQGFRIPGTITKKGDRAIAFQTGEKITIGDLLRYTEGFREGRERLEEKHFLKKKDLTIQKAQELFPEWFEKRIQRGEPKGVWHISRNVYEWWKDQIRKGAVVGHRYYCMMMLAVYAQKCSMFDPKHNPDPVTREELEKDAFELMDHMESLTNSEENHFTTGDVLDALEAFNEKWITYPRNSIEYRSGIRIDANKRNGRKQADHLRRARAVQMIDYPNGEWREGNGRKPKKDIVEEWLLRNPEGSKADCVRETGLSKPTVYKWWKNQVSGSVNGCG